jgi:hypothetical protein
MEMELETDSLTVSIFPSRTVILIWRFLEAVAKL